MHFDGPLLQLFLTYPLTKQVHAYLSGCTLEDQQLLDDDWLVDSP